MLEHPVFEIWGQWALPEDMKLPKLIWNMARGCNTPSRGKGLAKREKYNIQYI